MDKEYKGLKENLERFKNDLTDEKMRLLFSIAYKQGYDQALTIHDVVGRSEQLSCGRNITTCVFYKDGGKCSNLEYCRDQTT